MLKIHLGLGSRSNFKARSLSTFEIPLGNLLHLCARYDEKSNLCSKYDSKLIFDHFVFKVGVKIDFWQFYVQSISQNRSVTILNLYMGGGGQLTVFPVSIDVSTDVSTPVSTPVRVYPHLFDFFGNFKNSWKIYEPNKWKKCVSLLEFGAFLDFVAI